MHVLVTGSSGAIGSAIARETRRRHPHAKLSLVDVSAESSGVLARELGDADFFDCDLSKSDDVARVLARAREAHGAVDGLVNCAGFMEVRKLEAIPWERAEALLMVDLVAPLRLMHACAPDMIARGSGFVVNIASVAGKVTLRGCAFYCAAKSGLAMASEIARHELGPRGVRVVTVYPGPVRSPLESRARDQWGRGFLTRILPTGEPEVLARKIGDAIDADRARVVYPSFYGLALTPAGSPVAATFGPSAVD